MPGLSRHRVDSNLYALQHNHSFRRETEFLRKGRSKRYFISLFAFIVSFTLGRTATRRPETQPNFPYGHGPQGDAMRIYNFVRLVRSVN
jgi:hypothetical protein